LIDELADVIAIPRSLVSINSAKEGRGGVVFEIALTVEPRCLEQLPKALETLAFGIRLTEGCNLVAPDEYMAELQNQVQDQKSGFRFREDFQLLKKVISKQSFTYARVMHFCVKQPIWEYGAIVQNEPQCPYDMFKLSAAALVSGTIALMLAIGILSYLSHEFDLSSTLSKLHVLEILAPLISLYTVAADYMWLATLKHSSAHPFHDNIFMASLCHLLSCLCINSLAIRITITSYIMDTPWWRRNRKRLRPVLLVSILAPRFFRITRANIFGLDSTHIHFGTPSKMAVIFSNLGLVMLFQDIPQLLIHAYVWLIWQNQSPKISLICLFLNVLSIAVTALHHVFSRSQRAAYERVVKLLGVRRLTAGFFDVSAGVGQQVGASYVENMRRADKGVAQTAIADSSDAGDVNEIMDPTKLDPIKAAIYVSQMYESEARALADQEADGEGSSSSSVSDAENASSPSPRKKQIYPKALFDKLTKFYQHMIPQSSR